MRHNTRLRLKTRWKSWPSNDLAHACTPTRTHRHAHLHTYTCTETCTCPPHHTEARAFALVYTRTPECANTNRPPNTHVYQSCAYTRTRTHACPHMYIHKPHTRTNTRPRYPRGRPPFVVCSTDLEATALTLSDFCSTLLTRLARCVSLESDGRAKMSWQFSVS